MGVHSGPVNAVSDVNDRQMLPVPDQHGAAGNGLRPMRDTSFSPACRGRSGSNTGSGNRGLHDLGECEVKHGVRVHVVNLYTEEVGTRKRQRNSGIKKRRKQCRRSRVRCEPGWTITRMIAALIIIVAAPPWDHTFSHHRPARKHRLFNAPAALAIPEKSIAVLPFENWSEDKANAYFATASRTRF